MPASSGRPERGRSASAEHSDDALAAALRGFGFPGILASLLILLTGNFFVGDAIVPVGAVLALGWVRLSRTPWRDIGYAGPVRWPVTIVAGIALGIGLKLLMKTVVMPLLGAPPINASYHRLVGNTAALPAATWSMVVAGFAEETIFRGYLFERLGKLLGRGTVATATIVVVTSAWFGLAHTSSQGMPGVQQAAIVGLLYGTIYAVVRKIWVVMIAHAAFNLTALAIIYWDLETAVATLFFDETMSESGE